MLSHRKRLGASILLTFVSIVAIILLLPRDRLSQLQKITLIPPIDNYADLWQWGSGEDEDDGQVEYAGDGVRLVVFGDSWVDDVIEKGVKGRGKSWPQVLCEEINCTSRLSFSASQPSAAYLEQSPTGVFTSHMVHEWAHNKTQYFHLDPTITEPLPDFATQVQTFISLPLPKTPPLETIFVFSFGFWDIYDFAQVDYAVAQNATDDSVKEIFSQLDILYNHFTKFLYPPIINPNATSGQPKILQFKVIFPKLFDPTLTPGWVTLRPPPMKPSSVAEQQKNAVYLTQRWNHQVENSWGKWLQAPVVPGQSTDSGTAKNSASTSSSGVKSEIPAPTPSSGLQAEGSQRFVEKDIFYYDLEKTLLDLIVEHHLEGENLTDANGLGTGESPFTSIELPCLHTIEEGEDISDMEDLNGLLLCKQPDDYLWWDSWNVGGVVNQMIGKGIAEKVTSGRGLRSQLSGTIGN